MEIDEIISLFDKADAARTSRAGSASWPTAIEKGRGEDLNDAIGNLPRFVATGDDVLQRARRPGAGAAARWCATPAAR